MTEKKITEKKVKPTALAGFTKKDLSALPIHQPAAARARLQDIVADNRGQDNQQNDPLTENPIITPLDQNKVEDTKLDSIQTSKSKSKGLDRVGPKNYEDYFVSSLRSGSRTSNTPVDIELLSTLKLVAQQNKCTIMSLIHNILVTWKEENAPEINKQLKKAML